MKTYQEPGDKNAKISYKSSNAPMGDNRLYVSFFAFEKDFCKNEYLGTVTLNANSSSKVSLPVGKLIGIKTVLASGVFTSSFRTRDPDSLVKIEKDITYLVSAERDGNDFGTELTEFDGNHEKPMTSLPRSKSCEN